jgi:hypothetical protein
MKKVLMVILVIIVFVLGVILADSVKSVFNKIFKPEKEESTVESPEQEETIRPNEMLLGILVPKKNETFIRKKIHKDAEIGTDKKYTYKVAVFKENPAGSEPRLQIFKLDPEVIVKEPPEIPTDRPDKKIKIILDPSAQEPVSVEPSQIEAERGKDHLVWECVEKTSDGEIIIRRFAVLFLDQRSPVTDPD